MARISALPTRARNAVAVVALGALFILLSVLGPNWYKKEVEYQCPPDYKVAAVYADMLQCSKAMSASAGRGCSCSSAKNPWARIYYDYVVPPLIGFVAWLLVVGSVSTRIGLLNAGFWAAIVLLGVYYAFTNPEGVEGLALSFGHLVYVAALASAVLAVLHWLGRGVTVLRATT